MDRDRDRRDDRYSNSYRPRSPGSRIDSYRGGRSPPRGRLAADTYVPSSRASRPRSRSPSFRRRSRSPRGRDDGDRWRARPRSPIRRGFSPRRDDNYRSDARGRSPRRGREGFDSPYARSPRPVRERSPPPRDRDVSPARSRGMRSPPRVKRDRLDSPPRGSRYDDSRSRAHSPPRRAFSPRDNRDFRRRSPSPRRDRADPYTADTWRRRSPSPARPAYTSNEASGRESAATSRRSSPPVHATRAALVPDTASAPRSPYRERERSYDTVMRDRDRSPPRRRDSPPTGPRDRGFGAGAAPPTGPAHRNGDSFARAPPTGPSARNFSSPAISPPVGPSASSTPAPAYPRSSNPVLAAPTRPRGGGGRGYGSEYSRDYSGTPRRGSWGGGRGGYYGGAPSGPRGGGTGAYAAPFRGSSNSTSTTYPRTQRFRDHLADLTKEIPGGEKAPELYDKSKIVKLEEEARKLREAIEAKEAKKRQKLHEWDVIDREASNASLRSELAEQQLRNLNGEGETGGAAF